jgi:hypothetical protein
MWATGLFGLAGVLLGGAITGYATYRTQLSINATAARTGARTETMDLLRWAADKVTSGDGAAELIAVNVLDALDRSEPALLQPEDQGVVDAVLAAVTARPVADGAGSAASVTPAQRQAAGLQVRRQEERGLTPSSALRQLAVAPVSDQS